MNDLSIPRIETASNEAVSSIKARKLRRDAEGSILKRTEERRTTGGKTRKETVFYARCRYTDREGKKREKKRRCDSYNDALIKRRELREEIARELAESVEDVPPPVYFSEVLDYFDAEYVKPAEYSGNEKVAGYREDLQNIRRQLKVLRAEFGAMALARITYEDLKRFKEKRLKIPIEIRYKVKFPLTAEETAAAKAARKFNKKFRVEWRSETRTRKIASVNREMQRLRRIFNIAVQNGWLDKSPFAKGDFLISQASENERIRILSGAEEKRLLHAAAAHLKPVLICALDTALRKNEIFTLTWNDVDLDKHTISVKALNTKTLKPRVVPITDRLHRELVSLKKFRAYGNDCRVFGVSSVGTSFPSAISKAEIFDFRFHDLRATAITRLLRAGMPPAEVMKISGHTVWKTFMRYVRIDEDTISRSKNALDSYLKNLHEEN